MRTRTQTLTPLVLELGGKDPFIVCDDADVAAAVPIALRGTYQVRQPRPRRRGRQAP